MVLIWVLYCFKHRVASICASEVLTDLALLPLGSGGALGAGSSSNIAM